MIKNERQGFTLIEILIVVAIIAILASIVLVGLGPTQQSGRDAKRLSDLHEVQNGLELYYNACGYYPGTDVRSPCTGYVSAGGYESMKTILTGFTSLSISQMPDDPTAGHQYYYATTNTGSSYILGATLENTQNSVFTGYNPPTGLSNYTDGGTKDLAAFGNGCVSPLYCITL